MQRRRRRTTSTQRPQLGKLGVAPGVARQRSPTGWNHQTPGCLVKSSRQKPCRVASPNRFMRVDHPRHRPTCDGETMRDDSQAAVAHKRASDGHSGEAKEPAQRKADSRQNGGLLCGAEKRSRLLAPAPLCAPAQPALRTADPRGIAKPIIAAAWESPARDHRWSQFVPDKNPGDEVVSMPGANRLTRRPAPFQYSCTHECNRRLAKLQLASSTGGKASSPVGK